MRTVIATDRQSIVDIAIQYYGSAAGLIDLCQDNGWELDHDLQPGDSILLQDSYPESANGDIADYLQGNNVIVVGTLEQNTDAALGTNNDEFIITNNDDFIAA